MLGVKAKVIRAFYDMQDPKETVYQVGDMFEGAEKRVKELEGRGFVKAEEPKKRVTRKKVSDD